MKTGLHVLSLPTFLIIFFKQFFFSPVACPATVFAIASCEDGACPVSQDGCIESVFLVKIVYDIPIFFDKLFYRK